MHPAWCMAECGLKKKAKKSGKGELETGSVCSLTSSPPAIYNSFQIPLDSGKSWIVPPPRTSFPAFPW